MRKMKNLKVKWLSPQAGNSGIRLGTAKISVPEEEYVYVTGPCETELDVVNQISAIAELSKPKCVLEIYKIN
jgi:hypothetical protein